MPNGPRDITLKPQNHCFKTLRFFLLIISIPLVTSMGYSQPAPNRKFNVTIDAGHGGRDPGAVGKRSQEKHLALSMALKLGQYIENQLEDVNVFYTRKTDVLIPLYERAQIANRNNSDLFISIHVNSVKKGTPEGTSTYVMGFSRSAENLDLVKQENQAILLEEDYKTRYAGFDNSPESYIRFNNLQNNNLNQSLEVAAIIQDHFRTKAKRNDLGVHQGNLVVLWGCAKPSVLIETGFICTPREEEFLMSDSGQDIIVSAIFTAFRQYKESVDSRINGVAKVSGTKAETGKLNETNNNNVAVNTTEVPVQEILTDTTQPKTISVADSLAAPSDSGVEFRVQILASAKKLPLDSKEFKGFNEKEEIKLDGYYKYMSLPVKTYQEALNLRSQLAVKFREAFIVVFKDGKKVPLNSVVDLKRNN